MTYTCPKGHQSTDSDYCSECGALIGQSTIVKEQTAQSNVTSITAPTADQELCPDCGTPRAGSARFCEVCRHDFKDNKPGLAEAIVASAPKTSEAQTSNPISTAGNQSVIDSKPETSAKVKNEENLAAEKLNIVISVDKAKAADCGIETSIKPDIQDRVFPLDLDENLVGRRSAAKGIYPEIEINDPGVSHRHLKFIKQSNGSFSVLELGSANGTELNGTALEPGITTAVKAGDELSIGIWTILKLLSR